MQGEGPLDTYCPVSCHITPQLRPSAATFPPFILFYSIFHSFSLSLSVKLIFNNRFYWPECQVSILPFYLCTLIIIIIMDGLQQHQTVL